MGTEAHTNRQKGGDISTYKQKNGWGKKHIRGTKVYLSPIGRSELKGQICSQLSSLLNNILWKSNFIFSWFSGSDLIQFKETHLMLIICF